MAVIIKLNGIYIGTAIMTQSEIKKQKMQVLQY